MQRKVEKAVHEHGEAPAEGRKRDAPAEIVTRPCSHERLVKQQRHKRQRQRRADDAAVRKHLEIIVVRLLEPEKPVTRIELRLDDAERSEARADQRMRLDDLQSD